MITHKKGMVITMDYSTFIKTLELMGKGMLGIFVTITIVMLAVCLLSKIGISKENP